MSHKKLKSKRKEDKKLLQKTKSISKRRENYYSIIKMLEVEDQFKSIPNKIKEQLWEFSWPQIEICTNKIKDFPFHKDLEREISYELNNINISLNSTEVPVILFNNVIGLHHFMKSCYDEGLLYLKNANVDEKSKEICRSSIDAINYINSKLTPIVNQNYSNYLNDIINVASKIVLIHYNFENGIYPTLVIKYTAGGKKPYPFVELNKINIKKENLEINGTQRIGFPCPYYNYLGTSSVIFKEGVIDNEKPLPVYVQDHAISRLLERINIGVAGYLYDCLGRSLYDPINSGSDGDSYLIDYYLYSYKVGYLVVSKTKDFALVRSFKFITMTGTPEFNEIRKNLRATKYDVTYLGLDTLDILVNSDIAKDPKLKEVFTKCGLGHLFKLSERITGSSNFFQNPQNMVAEEIKKYFNF